MHTGRQTLARATAVAAVRKRHDSNRRVENRQINLQDNLTGLNNDRVICYAKCKRHAALRECAAVQPRRLDTQPDDIP